MRPTRRCWTTSYIRITPIRRFLECSQFFNLPRDGIQQIDRGMCDVAEIEEADAVAGHRPVTAGATIEQKLFLTTGGWHPPDTPGWFAEIQPQAIRRLGSYKATIVGNLHG